MDISNDDILNLFDSCDEVVTQLTAIGEFLESRPKAQVFFYYVGHGGFYKGSDYFLAARNLRAGYEAQTGFLGKAIADQLRIVPDYQGQLFMILDCCFAARILVDMMHQSSDGVDAILADKTFDSFPSSGVALLAATSKDDPAKASDDRALTLFTQCLLATLREGIDGGGARLTLVEVADETRRRIQRLDPGHYGLPQAHAPRQSAVDLTRLPVFRNAFVDGSHDPMKLAFQEKRKLWRGLDIVADIFKDTLGPHGENHRKTFFVRDGYIGCLPQEAWELIDRLELSDRAENVAVQVAKKAAVGVRHRLGDGSVTAVLLARALVREALQEGNVNRNYAVVRRGFEDAGACALQALRSAAIDLAKLPAGTIANIASSSAEDETIGGLVEEALKFSGERGFVSVIASTITFGESLYDLVLGNGFCSLILESCEEGADTFISPTVVVSERRIELNDAVQLVEARVSDTSRPIVIFCPSASNEASQLLRDCFWTIRILVPRRYAAGCALTDVLTKVEELSGSDVTASDAARCVTFAHVGVAAIVVIGTGNALVVGKRVRGVQNEKDTVAIIRAGANVKRVKEAVLASRAAQRGGVVEGGGASLLRARRTVAAEFHRRGKTPSSDYAFGWVVLARALEEPFRQIAENAGLNPTEMIERISDSTGRSGLNAKTGTIVELIDCGVVDPYLVVDAGLRSAIETAGDLLTAPVVYL